jgi:hypothetical protein
MAHRRDGGHGDLLDLVEGASNLAGHVRWRSHFCGSQRPSGHALRIGCAAFSSC